MDKMDEFLKRQKLSRCEITGSYESLKSNKTHLMDANLFVIIKIIYIQVLNYGLNVSC